MPFYGSTIAAMAMAMATAPLIAFAVQAAPKAATGNAAAGAKYYLQCRACHTVAKGGANGVGPNLWRIMGAQAARKPGYDYSPAMNAARLSWSKEAMDGFLARPNARVPGNKMAFAGMANPAARRDPIAYLATLHGQ